MQGALSGIISRFPAVIKTLVYDYVGNGVANREIDLGADFDFVCIFRNENTSGTDYAVWAYALRTFHGALNNNASYHSTQAYHGTNADSIFQGKMTGADSNKIKLASGTSGINISGHNYKLFALKFKN